MTGYGNVEGVIVTLSLSRVLLGVGESCFRVEVIVRLPCIAKLSIVLHYLLPAFILSEKVKHKYLLGIIEYLICQLFEIAYTNYSNHIKINN